MLDVFRFLPAIEPMSPADLASLEWKGALAHVGPLADMTPLQVALTEKTNCALYIICAGCVGLCLKRTANVIAPGTNIYLPEQIFAYQFDWRYPRVMVIDLDDIEDRKNRAAAIQQSIPYFFSDMVSRLPSFFLAESPFESTAFMINFTRHICGKANKKVVDRWVRQMIERLDVVAPQMEELSDSIFDYPSREEWEAAVRVIHGMPLPPEIMDTEWNCGSADLLALANGHLSAIDAIGNPLLVPPEVLIANGFSGHPYQPRL
jgi:hypothetical protein